MNRPVLTFCAACSRALDGEAHMVVTTRHGDRLPYCSGGCRNPTEQDLATARVQWVGPTGEVRDPVGRYEVISYDVVAPEGRTIAGFASLAPARRTATRRRRAPECYRTAVLDTATGEAVS